MSRKFTVFIGGFYYRSNLFILHNLRLQYTVESPNHRSCIAVGTFAWPKASWHLYSVILIKYDNRLLVVGIIRQKNNTILTENSVFSNESYAQAYCIYSETLTVAIRGTIWSYCYLIVCSVSFDGILNYKQK